jgi:hypothetical protein
LSSDFRSFVERGSVVIGIGRTDTHPEPSLDRYYDYLAERGLMLPVLSVDVRIRENVLMLFDVLLSILEVAED